MFYFVIIKDNKKKKKIKWNANFLKIMKNLPTGGSHKVHETQQLFKKKMILYADVNPNKES